MTGRDITIEESVRRGQHRPLPRQRNCAVARRLIMRTSTHGTVFVLPLDRLSSIVD
jgi:hypothetical protein